MEEKLQIEEDFEKIKSLCTWKLHSFEYHPLAVYGSAAIDKSC